MVYRWQELLDLLKVHKDKLERSSAVINLEREIDTLTVTIKQLQVIIEILEVIKDIKDIKEET